MWIDRAAYPRCPYRMTSKGYANGKAPDDICCEKICQEQNALGSKNMISLSSWWGAVQFPFHKNGKTYGNLNKPRSTYGNTAQFVGSVGDAFSAICCLQIFRFTSSKPSKSAIASDEKFIRLRTNSFVRYCLNIKLVFREGCVSSRFFCVKIPLRLDKSSAARL